MQMKHLKLLVAGMLAVVGVALTWRALDRTDSQRITTNQLATPEHIKAALESIELDTTPTNTIAEQLSETVGSDVLRLVQSPELRQEMPLTERQMDDLVKSVQERIMSVVAPDFERNSAFLIKRGIKINTDEQARQYWEQGVAWRGDPPKIAVDQITVLPIYRDGHRVASEPLEEGWSTLVSHWQRGFIPVGLDAEESNLTVIEVTIPMEHKGVRNGTIKAFPTGYQFAWDPQQRLWIPWQICIYQGNESGDDPFASAAFW